MKKRLSLVLIIAALIACYFMFDLGQYFNLEYVKSQQAELEQLRQTYPVEMAAAAFGVYVLVTALSLPGAAVMSLVIAAIFGLLWGTILVSFASTLGATLAFLIARFLFRDAVQKRLGSKLAAFNKGIEKDGAFYLFGLRLVPIFPFFMINLLMGLTPIRTWTYVWVSQVGMLAGTIVYVNAGTQLAQIESLSGILSLELLLSFALLGVFPLIAKKILSGLKARRVYAPFKRPSKFDHNIIVIGAGSGGLVSAYIAAAVKAKVTLIEKNEMGGDCLNTGCVPSKSLIHSARFIAQARRSQTLGIAAAEVKFDFAEIMQRVQSTIQQVAPHDSVERYTGLGVNVIKGEAKIISPFEVEVGDKTLTTRNIVIATGAQPFVPSIPGIEESGYLTSDTVWNLRTLPEKMLVLGAGPIGCELAQCFARFGSEVTMVQRGQHIMPREDTDVSDLVAKSMQVDGIRLCTGHTPLRFEQAAEKKYLVAEYNKQEVKIEFDLLLVAVGRKANVSGFGLQELGVQISKRKTIEVNEFLQTNYPNIYACGDVAGPYQFTHTASHQAWYAAVNALFGRFKKFKVDYSVIPFATFTEPEVARVGLNELEAKEKGIEYELTTYGIDDLDRAIADSEANGLVKVLTVPGKDQILGATIVSQHAGEMIIEFVTAMRYKLGLNKILSTIHIYPTWAEANKYAAGNWKKNHAPEKLLQWVEKFHAWNRKE